MTCLLRWFEHVIDYTSHCLVITIWAMASSQEFDLYKQAHEEPKAASDALCLEEANSQPNAAKVKSLKRALDDAKAARDAAERVYLGSRPHMRMPSLRRRFSDQRLEFSCIKSNEAI